MVVEIYIKSCMTGPDFLEKKFFAPIFGNIINFIYIMKYDYFLCSCTDPIFGKILVSEKRAKLFSANLIARFF